MTLHPESPMPLKAPQSPTHTLAAVPDERAAVNWRVSAGRLVRVVAANGDVICGVHRVGRVQAGRSEVSIEAETIAKARLLAAAPKLLSAAQAVLEGLNARIAAASALEKPVPIFHGIAELHDAITAAGGAP
jgi:hypothetical protein